MLKDATRCTIRRPCDDPTTHAQGDALDPGPARFSAGSTPRPPPRQHRIQPSSKESLSYSNPPGINLHRLDAGGWTRVSWCNSGFASCEAEQIHSTTWIRYALAARWV